MVRPIGTTRRHCLGLGAAAALWRTRAATAVPDLRAFGAVGDGRTDDTAAINRAIATVAAAGGGMVRFSAGTYRSYSIRLRSYVTLSLHEGATILAAGTPHAGTTSGGYDAAESNAPWEAYQDFGHNHWHNSLIWGEDIHDIAILGPGRIWGKGLSRGIDDADLPLENAPGVGNKAIALKNCHNVTLQGFSILAGGHFGILATGVDRLSVNDVLIDTNRDGMNIDCCRDVQIARCSVNSPWDDGICLKSSFALGYPRATENVTISDCYLCGYRLGSLLDGTRVRSQTAPASPTGRIKCGTESDGGFRNIAIRNCVFESCRGLALETVDGGILEDVTVTTLTMRDIRNAPFYLRLGARMRGPPNRPVGHLRRVRISNVTCHAPNNSMPAIISGIPGHFVEDVEISDVHVVQKGGGTAAMAAIRPPELVRDYPEPSRLGPLPAQHFFIRHAHGVAFKNVTLETMTSDARPVFWLDDVTDIDVFRLWLPRRLQAAAFMLNRVKRFRVVASEGIADMSLGDIAHREI